MQKKSSKEKKFLDILHSEKGDAMILVSIMITGLVVLVSTVALENLRKAGAVRGLQKTSLENLYKAEEGIELSLYANKEAIELAPSDGIDANQPFSFCETGSATANCREFNITVFDKTSEEEPTTGLDAINELARSSLGNNTNLVIVSQSQQRADSISSESTSSKKLKRTLMANLPSRYYHQAFLGSAFLTCPECEEIEAQTDYSEVYSDSNKGTSYDFIFVLSTPITSDFGSRIALPKFKFECKKDGNNKCAISNVEIKGANCEYSKDDNNPFTCKLSTKTEGAGKIGFSGGSSSSAMAAPKTQPISFGNIFDLSNLGDNNEITNMRVKFTVTSGKIKMLKLKNYPQSANIPQIRIKKNSSDVWELKTNLIPSLDLTGDRKSNRT